MAISHTTDIGEYLGLYNFVNFAIGKYSQFTFNLAIYPCNIEEEEYLIIIYYNCL